MATAARSEARVPGPTTVEEMEAWPDEAPGEIIDGVWVPKYSGGEVTGGTIAHGIVALEIGWLLARFVRPRRLGVVLGSETTFVLRRGPDLVRSADAAFVAAARLTAGIPTGFFRGAPDLVAEVLSPSNRPAHMAQKVEHYLRHGSRLVWVVDVDARAVTVHAPGAAPVRLAGEEPLGGGDVVPGFAVPVSALFAGLEWPAAGDPPEPPNA